MYVKIWNTVISISRSFDINVKNAPVGFRMELIDLQFGIDARITLPHVRLIDFHKLSLPSYK
jgi:hypothetical protein